MSAPPLSRKGQAQPLKRGSGVFDIIICGGHRERGGVTLTPSQWRQPSTRVPITVVQHSERHVVGEGMPLVDRENNLRIRGMWSSTPLGEYVRTLVAQEVLRYAELEYTDTIDDAGRGVERGVRRAGATRGIGRFSGAIRVENRTSGTSIPML